MSFWGIEILAMIAGGFCGVAIFRIFVRPGMQRRHEERMAEMMDKHEKWLDVFAAQGPIEAGIVREIRDERAREDEHRA